MGLNFCSSTAIELMGTYHTTNLSMLLPLLITTALQALSLAGRPDQVRGSGRGSSLDSGPGVPWLSAPGSIAAMNATVPAKSDTILNRRGFDRNHLSLRGVRSSAKEESIPRLARSVVAGG